MTQARLQQYPSSTELALNIGYKILLMNLKLRLIPDNSVSQIVLDSK